MTRPGPETREFLGGIKAFADLPEELLSAMWSRMEQRTFAPGDLLIRQEDPGDRLLVLFEGAADVTVRDQHGVEHRIARVGAGEVVGEMALITGERRGADVVAEQPTRVLALAAEAFHELARRHPELGMVLTNLIGDRLGQADWDALGGKTLEGYQILRCVGRGGMAVVYEARETQFDRRVALKMMSHRLVYDAASLSRFRQEADIVKTLEHENIARLFGRFSAYGTHFLVMEFCDGPGLDEVIGRGQPLAEDHVRRIVGQLARALQYIHARSVLHRDVKPSNAMLTREGVVKLMDFGLAKPLLHIDDRTITHELTLVGTPSYMAPEQLSGDELDARIDIYALACLAYMMLSGEKLFDTSNLLDLVRQKLSLALPPAEKIGLGISREMRDFLEQGLQPARDRRLDSLERYTEWAAPVDVTALEA